MIYSLIFFMALADIQESSFQDFSDGGFLADKIADPEALEYYRVSDFYYYEATGKTKGLKITNKLVVFFKPDFGNDEVKALYLDSFNREVAKIKEYKKQDDYFVVELEVNSIGGLSLRRSIHFIVEKLNQIGRYETVVLKRRVTDVMPVVVYENMECYQTNQILIQTKTPINHKLLWERLKTYQYLLGDFRLVELAGGEVGKNQYFLTVADLKWPPNTLVLSNLLSEQPWIDYARPVFENIDLPLRITFSIFPDGSPTLGEQRFLIMEAVFNDARYRLDKDNLPQLGQGEFSLKTLSKHFIAADNNQSLKGEEPEIREEKGDLRTTVVVKWPFYVYAPGKFAFNPIQIPYVRDNNGREEKNAIAVSPGNIYVGSIIENSPQPIDDIQPIKFYSASLQLKRAESVLSWFEKYHLKHWLGVSSLGLGVLIALLMSIAVVRSKMPSLRQRFYQLRKDRGLLGDFYLAIQSLSSSAQYPEVEKIFRVVITRFFGLPANACLNDLKEQYFKKYLENLAKEERNLIEDCLRELERGCDVIYRPTSNQIKAFSTALLALYKLALNKKN